MFLYISLQSLIFQTIFLGLFIVNLFLLFNLSYDRYQKIVSVATLLYLLFATLLSNSNNYYFDMNITDIMSLITFSVVAIVLVASVTFNNKSRKIKDHITAKRYHQLSRWYFALGLTLLFGAILGSLISGYV